jgi:hypothetical protein
MEISIVVLAIAVAEAQRMEEDWVRRRRRQSRNLTRKGDD